MCCHSLSLPHDHLAPCVLVLLATGQGRTDARCELLIGCLLPCMKQPCVCLTLRFCCCKIARENQNIHDIEEYKIHNIVWWGCKEYITPDKSIIIIITKIIFVHK